MARLMSFAMTQPQIVVKSKDVTRRWGWLFAKPGDEYIAVNKSMGFKKGESPVYLARIMVISARRERLDRMITEPAYGVEEMRREGYPFGLTDPAAFVERLLQSARGKTGADLITRIEFSYIGSGYDD